MNPTLLYCCDLYSLPNTRCYEDVLAEGEDEEVSQNADDAEAAYLIQEGWGEVWDRIVHQDQLRNKIKLGVNVMKIERKGLGDYV